MTFPSFEGIIGTNEGVPMKRDRTAEYANREYKRKNDHLFVAKEMFNKQKHRAKTHAYKTVEYTREEFLAWLYTTDYEELFADWVKGGNIKDMKPSIDRIDPTKGYDLTNIQLALWKENNSKGRFENSTVKPVLMFKDGELVKEYPSAVAACIEIAPNIKNPHKSHIYDHLSRKKHYNTFHGYTFQYKEGLQ